MIQQPAAVRPALARAGPERDDLGLRAKVAVDERARDRSRAEVEGGPVLDRDLVGGDVEEDGVDVRAGGRAVDEVCQTRVRGGRRREVWGSTRRLWRGGRRGVGGMGCWMRR